VNEAWPRPDPPPNGPRTSSRFSCSGARARKSGRQKTRRRVAPPAWRRLR